MRPHQVPLQGGFILNFLPVLANGLLVQSDLVSAIDADILSLRVAAIRAIMTPHWHSMALLHIPVVGIEAAVSVVRADETLAAAWVAKVAGIVRSAQRDGVTIDGVGEGSVVGVGRRPHARQREKDCHGRVDKRR